MDTDVLVVGAGPTGLMLANQLVRRGVGVRIIDRHPGPSQQTRALGVQARTWRSTPSSASPSRALELGKIATGANLWAQGRKMARVPLGDAGRFVTPYPYILILGQDDNERIMGDRLRDLGLSVEWNTELVGIEQQADGVAATLKLPGWRQPDDPRGVGRRLRRRAQQRARAQRHQLSRARRTSMCSSWRMSR